MSPWKIDLLDFMEKNFCEDLSMEEFASYSGRSLATFKRDFKKASPLSPQKWLIEKPLLQRLSSHGPRFHEGDKS
jgi:AraC family transcriptional regulator, exoenzyme S synthesis regulatory protein ExsA